MTNEEIEKICEIIRKLDKKADVTESDFLFVITELKKINAEFSSMREQFRILSKAHCFTIKCKCFDDAIENINYRLQDIRQKLAIFRGE